MLHRTGRRVATRPTARAGARVAVVALVLVSGLCSATTGGPLAAQGGDPSGADRSRNVELVGYADLGGRTNNAAVWGHRNFAYVGSSSTRGSPGTCQGNGVAIVDLTDPVRPVQTGALAERPGTSAEDVQVLTVFARSFTGDLLATGLQRCGPDGVGGLSLWDVTDPRAPIELSLFETGSGPSGVHELSLVRRGRQTLALLAVPFSESLDPAGQGDVRLLDVTDPRAPVQVAEWGIGKQLGVDARAGRGRDPHVYAHSVLASADGQRAYVSYWDAGVVILDISDPPSPRYLGRTTFADGEEGNAHSVALARGGRVLIQADEDTSVRSEAIRVEGTAIDGRIEAAFGSFRSLIPEGELVAPAAYVGRGCPAGQARDGAAIEADPYLVDPRGSVAIVDRGACTFVDKAVRAQAAGALAVVVVNDEAGLLVPDGDTTGVRVPLALVGGEAGARLKVALAAGPAPNIGFSAGAVGYDDWGYLRLWDVSNPASPVQLSTFATARTRTDRALGPPDDGWYTTHHPVVLGDRAYVAWYGDGLRVLDIADPTRPREVGYFVPPGDPATPEPTSTSTATLAPSATPTATVTASATPTASASSMTTPTITAPAASLAAPAATAAEVATLLTPTVTSTVLATVIMPATSTPVVAVAATAPATVPPATVPAIPTLPTTSLPTSPSLGPPSSGGQPAIRAAEGQELPRASVWGVYTRGDLILASDERLGLYVLRDRTR